jgi:hypothetical protein
LYEDFWYGCAIFLVVYDHGRRDYRVFLVKGDEPPPEDEPKPADVRKAVQDIMEYLKKEHPQEIDLGQVLDANHLVFMQVGGIRRNEDLHEQGAAR